VTDDVTYKTRPTGIPAETKIATDDVGGAHYQRVKLDLGADGASSPVYDYLQTIDFPHFEIHEGDHYYIEGFATLALDANMYVKLVTPDNTKWAHFTWDIQSTGILTAYLYEGVSGGMADGNSVTPLNSNRNSTNTSGIVITSGVTVATDLGLTVSQCSWGSRQSTGGQSREDELILKQDTIYLRHFLSGVNGNVVCFRATWYEHTF